MKVTMSLIFFPGERGSLATIEQLVRNERSLLGLVLAPAVLGRALSPQQRPARLGGRRSRDQAHLRPRACAADAPQTRRPAVPSSPQELKMYRKDQSWELFKEYVSFSSPLFPCLFILILRPIKVTSLLGEAIW